MKRTALSHYSDLLLAIYRQAQELPVDQFQDSVLDTLKHYLPFDSSMWGTATMTAGGIDIHSLHLHNTTQRMIDEYQEVKHLDEAAMRVTQCKTATLAFCANTDFPGTELAPLRDYMHRFQHENLFITSDVNPITRFVHWVSLYRAQASQLCTSEETEMLSCIGPHLMQALAINRLVHLDRLTGDLARETWSVAIADSRGVLYHADPAFREIVGREWPAGAPPDPAQEERLPQALLEQLVADEGHVTGRQVVVRRTLERGLLFLKARRREPVDSLTARELLIARLVVSGLTHKQVAQKLERSPETVRSQVKSIYDKLGINNGAQLAPLLVLRD
jgi:DNA-binding CsgD family transcriptional regulator